MHEDRLCSCATKILMRRSVACSVKYESGTETVVSEDSKQMLRV